MRFFLHAVAVLALLGTGVLNIASPSAVPELLRAAKASVLGNEPLRAAIKQALCNRPDPATAP
jgi:hypothetical protein